MELIWHSDHFQEGKGFVRKNWKKPKIILIIEIILNFEMNNQNRTWLYSAWFHYKLFFTKKLSSEKNHRGWKFRKGVGKVFLPVRVFRTRQKNEARNKTLSLLNRSGIKLQTDKKYSHIYFVHLFEKMLIPWKKSWILSRFIQENQGFEPSILVSVQIPWLF